jgi:hypothetical protein
MNRIRQSLIAILLLIGSIVGVTQDGGANHNASPYNIAVYDYTEAPHRATVQSIVADLNSVVYGMNYAPHFVYFSYPVKRCNDINPVGYAIKVCNFGAGNATIGSSTGVVPNAATLRVRVDVVSKTVYCHELMHITTGIADNNGARSDSCVWGYMSTFGPFDIEVLRQRWG